MKLYEIHAQIAALLAETAENEGELTDAQMADLAVLEIEFDEKAQNIVLFARQQEAEADVIKAEVQRLSALAKRRERNVERLKAYLLTAMKGLGLEHAGGTLAGARIRKSPPAVSLLDESKVPPEFVFLEPRIEMKRILEKLKAGEAVAGTVLKQGEHVRFI